MKFKLVGENEVNRASMDMRNEVDRTSTPDNLELRGSMSMRELRESCSLAKDKSAADAIIKMHLRKDICVFSEQLDKKDTITDAQMQRAAKVPSTTLDLMQTLTVTQTSTLTLKLTQTQTLTLTLTSTSQGTHGREAGRQEACLLREAAVRSPIRSTRRERRRAHHLGGHTSACMQDKPHIL